MDSLGEQLVQSMQLIRGEDIVCQVKKWVCAGCEAAFMSPSQATESVKAAVIAYQQKHRLLTAGEIRAGRHRLQLGVSDFAHAADLGEATVKRLEAGTTVQQPSTNRLLLTILSEEQELPDYTISMDCSDFGNLCLPVPSYWGDEKPWNEKKPWKNHEIDMDFNVANSNDLALAG
jgi:DNA-binding transcriptional regulator YiaG